MADEKVEAPVAGFIDQSGGKNTFEIDFGALKAKAAEILNAAPETVVEKPVPVAPVVPDPTVVKVKGASDGQEPASKPAEAVVAKPAEPEVVDPAEATPQELSQLDDTALVSVPVDGVDTTMTWKEAKAGFSRTAKFTQSMQKLAQEKSDFASEKSALTKLREERAGLENFLTNKDALVKYVLKEFGPDTFQVTEIPQGTNPDEIVTYREAHEIANRSAQTFQQQLDAVQKTVGDRIAAATLEIENRQETAKHAVVMASTLAGIFASNPVLKSIPNAEDLIRFEVAKLRPETQEAAVQAFKDVSQGMVEDIGKHFAAQNKIAKVAAVKAKLESKSIEPAGGSAPQIEPANFKNPDGTVNWNKVRDMARSAA